MKHTRDGILLILSLVFFLPSLCFPASLLVSWTANTESDLAGYKIYSGTQSRTYGTPVTVGKITSYQLNNMTTGRTYYVALTAYDTSGNESGYSTESSVYIPPATTTTTQPTLSLLSPPNGAVLSTTPRFTWTGTGMAKYRVMVTLNRTNNYQVYTGTGTTYTLSSVYWSLFIPSGTTVSWWVEGTTSAGTVYKSATYSFRKQ